MYKSPFSDYQIKKAKNKLVRLIKDTEKRTYYKVRGSSNHEVVYDKTEKNIWKAFKCDCYQGQKLAIGFSGRYCSDILAVIYYKIRRGEIKKYVWDMIEV
jgi:ABC-type transport system involved in cytochrome bd biosynthesis fused ATPase/permease subunit